MEFSNRVLNPESWFKQSWEMFEAANVLWIYLMERNPTYSERDSQRDVGSLKGALLLLGLSVENALKGAYVYLNKPDISDGRLSPRHFHDAPHDLNDIAGKLGLSLDANQCLLLTRLTMCIQWASKYKAPLKKSDLDEMKSKVMLKSSDLGDIEEFIDALQNQSGYSKSSGWSNPDIKTI